MLMLPSQALLLLCHLDNDLVIYPIILYTRYKYEVQNRGLTQSQLEQQTYLHALLTSSISTASLVPITLHPPSSP